MKPNFKRKVLKNGMTILFEKRNLPIVSVAFAVRNGGVNEFPDEKGISHFIEHMLYKGTPTRNAKQIANEIERRGGELNGLTSEEITAFFCKMPSKHLNVALDVLSDMVKNPLFDKKELEKEKKVIFEEIRMNHDNPLRHVFHEIEKYLYTNSALNIIGTFATMNSIDRKKIVEKFEKIYSPNNLILCVVGDADLNKIVKFVEKNFGNKKAKIPEQKFKLKNKTGEEKRKGLDQANLIFAYHVPLAKDKKSHAAKVLSLLMAEGMSSRLWAEIREKRNLAYVVKGGCESEKRFGYNFIYVGTTKEKVKLVKKLILKEFEKVAAGLTERELKEVKEQMISNYHINMEDSQSQMLNLLIEEIHGNAKDFYEFEKNIKAVKLKDVKELAGKAAKKYSFFALIPANK